MPDPTSDDLVVVGRIRRSHGLHGIVVVEPMTSSPGEVYSVGRSLLAGSVKGDAVVPHRRLRIELAEPFQGGFRVQFSEIVGRDEADRWRDRYLLLPREELPEPEAGEVYLHDLVGMQVELEGGEVLGTVQAYYELPHDIMIEVPRGGGTVLIPYRFATEVDVPTRRIVVDLPDGLLGDA